MLAGALACNGKPGGGLPRDRDPNAGSSTEQSRVGSLSRETEAPGDGEQAAPEALEALPDEGSPAGSDEATAGQDDSEGADGSPSSEGPSAGDDAPLDGPGGAAGDAPPPSDGDTAPGDEGAPDEGAPGDGAQPEPGPAQPPDELPVPPLEGALPSAVPREVVVGCPPEATYCSSFEGGDLLEGASYVSQAGAFVPGQSMITDTLERFSGTSSLQVPAIGGQGFDYRVLSVPTPGIDFWVRLYLRTDVAFGDGDGDFPLLASVLAEDFNGDRSVALSEQFNQILLNKNGQLHGATAPNPDDSQPETGLEADTWYCVEGFFGGSSGDVFVFVGGVPVISAPAFAPDDYLSFRFGYVRFNTDRNWWFDDVAVSTARIGCE